MSVENIRLGIAFIILCAAQVLVLGNIHLLGFATPMPYIYILLLMPRDCPRYALLLCGFAMGVIIDVFANTPGVAAASMTLLAMVRHTILEPFIPRDSDDDLAPTMTTIGKSSYFYYTVICTVGYCAVFFALEIFCIYDYLQWAKCTLGSSVVTIALIVAVESAWHK